MSLYSDFKPRKTRNFIDNASFAVLQRGTGPFTTSSGITADRWGFPYSIGADSASITIQTVDNPPSTAVEVSYANLRINAVTQKTTYSSGEYIFLRHSMEGWNFLGLVGQMATLSFWVKATVPGKYAVNFRNNANTASYVSEYTIYASDTWERKVINVSFDYGSVGSGGWNLTSERGVQIGFTAACGSTYQTSSLDQWISGNYLASTNQAVYSSTINNIFAIARIQLELGMVTTPFEVLDLFTEYNRALRYFEYKYLVVPATQTANSNGVAYFNIEFAEKRIKPSSITVDSPRLWNSTWRNATSTTYNTAAGYPGRALMIFYDNVNTDYSTSFSNLCDGAFNINSELL
jgi:hypothetical protein